MKTLRTPMVSIIALMGLMMACSFFDQFHFGLAGPQAPADIIGTQVFPDTTPIIPAPNSQQGSCFVPANAYLWAYEDFEKIGGSGGEICHARFTFRNTSSEPVNLVVYSAWNNNAMAESRWDTYQVPAGGEWGEDLNRTNYKNGTVTYSKIEKFLVIRDKSECSDLLLEENMPVWEEKAVIIDDFACP